MISLLHKHSTEEEFCMAMRWVLSQNEPERFQRQNYGRTRQNSVFVLILCSCFEKKELGILAVA